MRTIGLMTLEQLHSQRKARQTNLNGQTLKLYAPIRIYYCTKNENNKMKEMLSVRQFILSYTQVNFYKNLCMLLYI